MEPVATMLELETDERHKRLGTRRCDNRRPRLPGFRGTRASSRYRGSIWRRRKQTATRVRGKLRPDRPKCRRFPRPRDGRHRSPPVAKISMPREPCDKHGRGDRGARRAFARGDKRQIAPRSLHHAAAELTEPVDLLARKAHSEAASMTAIVAGMAPISRDRILDGQGRLNVARVGHAVRDDRSIRAPRSVLDRARLSDPRGKSPKDRRRSSFVTSIADGRDHALRAYRQSPFHDQWRQFVSESLSGR